MSSRHFTFRLLSRTHGGPTENMVGMSSRRNRRERRPYFTKLEREAIVTLDPNKLVEKKQKPLSLGNKTMYTAHIKLDKQSTCEGVERLVYDRSRPGTLCPYPPYSKAFLYYIVQPGRPRITGELRFRVTSSDDPASFASGSDLQRLNGRPWSRPIYTISKSYTLLYQKLREEKLVPDDLDSILSNFSVKHLMYSLCQHLYTLNDTFIIDFSNDGQYFSVITEQGMEGLPLRRQFFDGRESRKGAPYTGSAMARFERSPLPDHAGTRTVVLRFLKIITPIKCVMPLYDGYIGFPREGELYHRNPYPIKSNHQVWSVNLDKQKGRGLVQPGLRLLWDA